MKTKDLTRIAIFAAITACLAQIIIPLPFTPIFVSMGILAVLLTGAILTPKQAFLAELVYILLGAIGMPVFGGFKGGIGVLFGPTGGYLYTYPIMAWIISFTIEKAAQKAPSMQKLAFVFGMILAMVICYGVGTIWLSYLNGITLYQAFMAAVVPFLLPDCGKIIVATLVGIPVRTQVTEKYLALNQEEAEIKEA
ncbi:MAG: biotin transporter BioY [Peptococcaceae bacterium]|nr:biotin transporter BioY [Peptococcaceae bacterium]